MNILGWLLTLIGSALAFYGGVIGAEVWGRYGTTRVMHMPTLLFGGLMLIIGVMLLLAKMLSKNNGSTNLVEVQKNQIFNGIARLENDAYKIYLTKCYEISFSDALKKYICADRLFEDVDGALLYAKELDWERNNIVDGVVKASENYDGQVICPICNAGNSNERTSCRACGYTLVIEKDANLSIVDSNKNEMGLAIKFLGVVIVGFLIWFVFIRG